MKTVEVHTYTKVNGKHYFGGTHVVEDDVAKELIANGAEEIKPPKAEKAEEPKAADSKATETKATK
jgi:hypothetical protein